MISNSKERLYRPIRKHIKRFNGETDKDFIDMAHKCATSQIVKRALREEAKANRIDIRKTKEYSERMAKLSAENYNRIPGLRERISKGNKERWKNPEFKERLEAGIQKMTEAKYMPVVCRGIEYPSMKDACNGTGSCFRTIKKYCDDPSIKDWYYVDKESANHE